MLSDHIRYFYTQVFEMPDYDAIEDHGDFKYSTRHLMSSSSRVSATKFHVRFIYVYLTMLFY